MNDFIQWSPGITLEAIEKMVILKAYSHYKGNKTTTAQSLGISIRTLDNKLEKYDLEKQEEDKKHADRESKRQEWLMRSRGNPPNNIGAIYSPFNEIRPTNEGLRPQSSAEIATQPPMPMPKRPEVQTVLSQPASKVHPRR